MFSSFEGMDFKLILPPFFGNQKSLKFSIIILIRAFSIMFHRCIGWKMLLFGSGL